MKLLIDIYHLPQYNFFKQSMIKLAEIHNVHLGTVRRGRQVEVIQTECPQLPLTIFGDYRKNKGTFSFITRVVLPRIFSLYRWIRKEKFDLVITANYQANIVAKWLGIPSVGFNDDPEKINLKVLKRVADEVYIPVFGVPEGKTRVFNALKEWAYLSPRYFSPSEEALKEYGLKPKEYFFMREVSTKSLNYRKQQPNPIARFARQLPRDFKVVLSLEDKSSREMYPEDWIVLQEPVKDIHSLMYFSRILIASGDSMAREGAMLGVPSIYCGIRDMAANRVLMEKNMLFKVPPLEVPAMMETVISGKTPFPVTPQDDFRRMLLAEWEDVTDLILSIVKRYNV